MDIARDCSMVLKNRCSCECKAVEIRGDDDNLECEERYSMEQDFEKAKQGVFETNIKGGARGKRLPIIWIGTAPH